MRAAPAFELDVAPGRRERAALAMIGGACAAVVAAWIWSHVDAAAGPAGRGATAWLALSAGAAVLGGWAGWRLAPRDPHTLAWRQGQWTLCRRAAVPCEGTVQVKLDLGGWMLLRFRPTADGAASWLAVSDRAAGPAWHPLRATLFAPGVSEPTRGPGQGVDP
jgi:hypothetical protein